MQQQHITGLQSPPPIAAPMMLEDLVIYIYPGERKVLRSRRPLPTLSTPVPRGCQPPRQLLRRRTRPSASRLGGQSIPLAVALIVMFFLNVVAVAGATRHDAADELRQEVTAQEQQLERLKERIKQLEQQHAPPPPQHNLFS